MFYITEEQFNSNIDKRIHKDINAFELKEPVPYLGHSPFTGFYYAYGYNNEIIINKDSVIINIKTQNTLSSWIHTKQKRAYVGISNYSVILYRILSLTFIPRPLIHVCKDYSELQVNHIDGNALNNSLVNLEWCTNTENCIHSYDNLDPENVIKIAAKNLTTKEIKKFVNSDRCAKEFNINKQTFWNHVNSSNLCKGYKDNWIFKIDDDSLWIDYPEDELFEIGKNLGNVTPAKVDVTTIKDGITTNFDSIIDASKFTNIKYRFLSYKMNTVGFYNDSSYKIKRVHALNRNILNVNNCKLC